MKRASLLPALLVGSLALGACSDESGRTALALEEVQQGLVDAMEDAAVAWEGLRELGAAQKEVFVERAGEQLVKLDEQLAKLREEAERAGEDLADGSREKLEELERKRAELEPKLERLEGAGDAAFDELRDGFIAALEAFQEAAAEPAAVPASDR